MHTSILMFFSHYEGKMAESHSGGGGGGFQWRSFFKKIDIDQKYTVKASAAIFESIDVSLVRVAGISSLHFWKRRVKNMKQQGAA